MNKSDFEEWFNGKQLTDSIEKWQKCIKKILKNNFDPYSKAVILSDYGYPTSKSAPMLAKLYSLALSELNIPFKIVFQEPKSNNGPAEKEIISSILESDSSTLIILTFSQKLGSLELIGKSFRKYVNKNKISFLSTSGLVELKTEKFDKFMESIDVNYGEISKKGQILKDILDKGKEMKITTSAGTNLIMDISEFNAIINDGLYHGKKGGNLPVGEVYIAPKKRTGKGKLILDVSSKNRHGTTIIKEQIILTFKEGEVITIDGGEEAEKLKESLEFVKEKAKHPWGIKLIGEIGIGINPKAEILGPTIINEKKAGTAHIALGSNSWFGGDIFALNHYDQVFNDPKIEIDGVPIDLKSILSY